MLNFTLWNQPFELGNGDCVSKTSFFHLLGKSESFLISIGLIENSRITHTGLKHLSRKKKKKNHFSGCCPSTNLSKARGFCYSPAANMLVVRASCVYSSIFQSKLPVLLGSAALSSSPRGNGSLPGAGSPCEQPAALSPRPSPLALPLGAQTPGSLDRFSRSGFHQSQLSSYFIP